MEKQTDATPKNSAGASTDAPPLKYPRGFDLIREGTCPIGAHTSVACQLCDYGHVLECHHPHDCATAKCLSLAAYDTHEPLERKANA